MDDEEYIDDYDDIEYLSEEDLLKSYPGMAAGAEHSRTYAIIPKPNKLHEPIKAMLSPLYYREEVEGLWSMSGEPFGRCESIDTITMDVRRFARGKEVSPYNEWKDPQDNMVGRWISRDLLVEDNTSYFLDVTPQLLNKIAQRQRVALRR